LSSDLLCILIVTDHVSTHGQSQRRLRVELEYVRLVEDYWETGRSKRRVIANFRRKDLFAPHLERLIEPYCPWNRDLKRFTINN
jgi:hypothetical protein